MGTLTLRYLWLQSFRMTELINWLKSEEKSFVDARVVIKDAKFGKGLFADEDIDPGMQIIRAPLNRLLTVNDGIKSEAVNELIAHALEPIKLNSLEVLTLLIYTEKDNPDSAFQSYISLLPQKYTSPITWPEQRIKQLPGFLSQQLLSIKKRLKEITVKLVLDYDKFIWSFCSTFTRSFSARFPPENFPDWFVVPESGDYPFSCPVVDMANHSTSTANLTWSGVNHERQEMYLKTHKKITKGSEICISYGLQK